MALLRLDLDTVHVYQMTSHCVLAREDSLTNRTDRVAPVYTAVVGEGVAAIVGFAANVANPAARLVVQRPSAPSDVEDVAIDAAAAGTGTGTTATADNYAAAAAAAVDRLKQGIRTEHWRRRRLEFVRCFCAHNPKCFSHSHTLLALLIVGFFFLLLTDTHCLA